MNRLNNTLLFLLIFLTHLSFSQDLPAKLHFKVKRLPFGITKKIPYEKPSISLALSGGGARAISHIGVLKALEEHNIKVDNIVATSMGSVIGGLYTIGYSIDDLEKLIYETKWEEFFYFSNRDRKNLFIDDKITEDKALLTIRLQRLNKIIPQSINVGNKISNFLTKVTLSAPLNNVTNFDNFLYKYRAVSTDLLTGKKIILSSGSLSEAMRASSSVSFLLPPIKKDSLLLVDGGLVDNLPIETATELNPDIIIAADATSSLRNKEELNYPWEIADQIVTIPSKKLWEKNLEKADIVIIPDLDHKKNNDFNNLAKIINAAYESAKIELYYFDQLYQKRYRDKLKKNDKDLKLYIVQPSNFLEKKIVEKFGNGKKIKKSDLLYELYNEFEKGRFKDIYLKFSKDTLKGINFKRYTIVNKIKINIKKNVSLFAKDDLDSLTNGLLGKEYNPDSVLTSALSIVKFYRDNDLLLANIDSINFDERKGILSYFIDEGIVSEIKISGNKKTLKHVIKRELTDIEGNYLQRENLNEGINNLSSTELFNSINLTYKKDSLNNNILNLKVDEKIPNVLRLGFKIDNEYNTQAALDIRNENLFGTGSELGLSFAGGSRSFSSLLEHRTNRIFETYLTYKAQIYYKQKDINIYSDDKVIEEKKFHRSRVGEYEQSLWGGFLGIGTHLERFGTFTAQAKYEVNRLKNIFNFNVPFDKLNIMSFKVQLKIDSQNKYPYPTSGNFVNAYYETAQKIFDADASYAKFFFNYKGHFSFSNHTITPKLIIGFADETLPLTQQFNFGGQYDFMGYREYEFRGRQIFITSIQYRYKIPINLFFDTYVLVRYDLGSSWEEQENIRFSNLRHGAGFTLSFDTPVGPADFSVGRSILLKQTTLDKFVVRGPLMFYFNIGYYY